MELITNIRAKGITIFMIEHVMKAIMGVCDRIMVLHHGEQIYQTFPILKERAGQLARTLSGGEQQMLAMGRGLMSKPKLCMFDEPSYGLAPRMLSEVFQVIKSLREQGITILLIEQNVPRTLEIADRAYVLENGRIVLEGACDNLLKDDYVRKAYLGL